MSLAYEQVKKIVRGALSGESGVPVERLREEVADASRNPRRHLSPEEQEELVAELLANFSVVSQDYQSLDNPDTRQLPWLPSRRNSITWSFWSRYRDYLELEGLAPDTINRLDDLTDGILDRLADPAQSGPSDRRGMVVGHVQSGKTGNYTGLICKAADAGYRVVIVLTGLHSSLRRQTQQRLDAGFLGFDTLAQRNYVPGQEDNLLGVGRINKNVAAHALTTSAENGDFSTGAARSSGTNIRGTDPVLIVVKKNVKVLNNLIYWLGNQGTTVPGTSRKIIQDLPMLLIDDEADNASINVSEQAISSINGSIRALLTLFSQRGYVGYTATPYANVFIPLDDGARKESQRRINGSDFVVGQDLFPRDFIINLPAPSNYIGPGRIFGLGAPLGEADAEAAEQALLPMVRPVTDYGPYIPDRHKNAGDLPDNLPPSLKGAIRSFVVASAVRRARSQQEKHHSMLVHVSRFVSWQNQIGELVLAELKEIRHELRYEGDDLRAQLRELWETDFRSLTDTLAAEPEWRATGVREQPWEAIEAELLPAVEKMQVRVIHGSPSRSGPSQLVKPLDYTEYEVRGQRQEGREYGLSVIAVGGDKLSRGLTLDGLSTSYFLRASRMYDTLMQMGRWFGYRPGYVDVCRLFTTPQLVEWYQHIAFASEEMREQFEQMARLNTSPEKYGIKIRTLPGVLQITAATKMRSAVPLELSYSDRLIETYAFARRPEVVQKNYEAVVRLLAQLPSPEPAVNDPALQKYAWRNVSYDLINEFLGRYSSVQESIQPGRLTQYIREQAARGQLKSWTVVLVNSTGRGEKYPITAGAHSLNVTSLHRAHSQGRGSKAGESKEPPTGDTYLVSRSHIISPVHEYLDLTEAQVEEAHKAFVAGREAEHAKKVAEAATYGRPAPPPLEPAPDRPSGFYIRQQRPDNTALLLLYPLDPKPANMASDTPIMAYAISFPELKNDKRYPYAANSVFHQDFASEFDEQDQEEEDALLN